MHEQSTSVSDQADLSGSVLNQRDQGAARDQRHWQSEGKKDARWESKANGVGKERDEDELERELGQKRGSGGNELILYLYDFKYLRRIFISFACQAMETFTASMSPHVSGFQTSAT